MNRVAITDGGGSWFDMDSSKEFREGKYWNGSNNISLATGSQNNFESLYLTKSNKWVLERSSNYGNSRDTYQIVDKDFVAEWFVKNEYADKDIPTDVLMEKVKSLEI